MKDENQRGVVSQIPQQQIVDFSDALEPYQSTIGALVKAINTSQIFSQAVMQQSKQLQTAVIALQKPSQQMAEAVKAVTDSRLIIQQVFSNFQYPTDQLKNVFVNLSTLHSFVKISGSMSLRLDLKSVRATTDNNVKLHSQATQTVQYKQFSFTSSAEIQLTAKIRQLEGQNIDLAVRVSQLEAMAKAGQLVEATIKLFGFDRHNSTLTIRGLSTTIRANSKQVIICNCLFNQEDICGVISIDDLVAEYQGQLNPPADMVSRFKEEFRQAARHLNTKIDKIFGLPNFILQSNGEYKINKLYLDFFV